MTLRKYGYIRVSTKTQNINRQIDQMKSEGIDEKFIFVDKMSGKDFDRPNYQFLKRILSKDDILIISSIDRLGRNYQEILNEWRELTTINKADIKVLDMPLLDTTNNKNLMGTFISDLTLQILSFVAERERESIRTRQSLGISSALKRGVKFGRPSITIDEEKFDKVYASWKNGEIKAVEAMKILGLKKATFYRKVKEFEENRKNVNS